MKKLTKKSIIIITCFVLLVSSLNLIFADNSGTIESVSLNYDGSDIVQNVCSNTQSDPNPDFVFDEYSKRVESEEELKTIIEDPEAGIITIYLAFDWDVNKQYVPVTSHNLKIVGRDPKTGIRHTITQNGTAENNGIRIESSNRGLFIEISDAQVLSTTENGLVYTKRGDSRGPTFIYSDVCFEGPRIAQNTNGTLILENSYFNIDRQAQGIELSNLSDVNTLELRGKNIIKNTSNSENYELIRNSSLNIKAADNSETKISTTTTISNTLSNFELGENARMILDVTSILDNRIILNFNKNGQMTLNNNSEMIINLEPNSSRNLSVIKSKEATLNNMGGRLITNINGLKSMSNTNPSGTTDQPFFEFKNINIGTDSNSRSSFIFNVKEINGKARTDHTLIKGNFNSLSNLDIELNTQSNIDGVLASLISNTSNVANTSIDNSSFSVQAEKVGDIFSNGQVSDPHNYVITNTVFDIKTVNGDLNKTLFNANGLILGANNTFNIKANNIDITDGKALINTNYPNDPMSFNNMNINLELNGYSNNALFDYKNIQSVNNSNINIELTGLNQSLLNSMNDINFDNSTVVFNNHGNQAGSLINSNGNVSLSNSHFEANVNNRTEGNMLKANDLKVVDSNLILNLDSSENIDPIIHLSGNQLNVNYDNYINELYGSFLVSSPSDVAIMNSNDNLNLDLSIQQINFWNHKETGIDEYQPDIRFYGCGNQIAPFNKVGTGAATDPENQIQSDFKRCGDDPKASENQFDLSNPDLHIWSMGYIQQKINSADSSTGNVSGISPSNAVNIVRYKDSNAALQSATTISNENQFSIDIPNMKEFIKVDTYFNKLSVDGEIKILQSDGKLELIHVDDQFVFSNLPISSKDTIYPRNNKYTYSVLDGRYYDPEWRLTLTQVSPITNSTTNEEIVDATFVYKYSDGTTVELKQGEAIEVYESSKLQNNTSTFTWNEDEGLLLRVSDPRNINSIDEFSAQFEWQLISTK